MTVSSSVTLFADTMVAAMAATFCFSSSDVTGPLRVTDTVKGDDFDVVGIGRKSLVRRDRLANLRRGHPVRLGIRLVISGWILILVLLGIVGCRLRCSPLMARVEKRLGYWCSKEALLLQWQGR